MKLKIDIWSDVRCPFCYIGKRKFERGLANFEHRDKVEVIWHSFQLDPGLQTQTDVHAFDYLSKAKGITREDAEQMHERVVAIGREVDIKFSFDRVIVANSFDAHRLIQLAKTKGLADAAEEALFKGHFADGKNIDDHEALIEIGKEIFLAEDEVRAMLASGDYADAVQQDEALARSIGIRGVPFFILNDTYAISGAQAPEMFQQALEKVWQEVQASIANV